MSWHKPEIVDINEINIEAQQSPIKVNIIIEYVDEENNEEERMEVEECVYEKSDFVNTVMKTAHIRKKEFLKLLDEYSELVKEIQRAERKLMNEKFSF
ncbi:uncharacterized protein LOC111640899 isoform X2 [Centruroides sculpturatus]|nr:uncharacterized protein LOC111640899 isoform X2 [Centruroides sculpturatus]